MVHAINGVVSQIAFDSAGRVTNRTDPPDSILREVWTRSGGKPFARIEDVIATAELEGILDRYKKVAGFDRETLRSRPSFV